MNADLLVEFSVIAFDCFVPYEGVFIRIGFDLGPVKKVVLKTDVALLEQKMNDFIEHIFNDILHVTSKTVDCPKVWRVVAGQPNEIDVFPKSLGDLTGRIDPLRIREDHHLQHHLRMVCRAASAGIPVIERRQIQFVDDGIYDSHEMIFWDNIPVREW